MYEVTDLYNIGAKYWNKSDKEQAIVYMDNVFQNFEKLDTYDKKT